MSRCLTPTSGGGSPIRPGPIRSIPVSRSVTAGAGIRRTAFRRSTSTRIWRQRERISVPSSPRGPMSRRIFGTIQARCWSGASCRDVRPYVTSIRRPVFAPRGCPTPTHSNATARRCRTLAANPSAHGPERSIARCSRPLGADAGRHRPRVGLVSGIRAQPCPAQRDAGVHGVVPGIANESGSYNAFTAVGMARHVPALLRSVDCGAGAGYTRQALIDNHHTFRSGGN